MNKILFSIAYIALGINMASGFNRIQLPLNDGWKFTKGDIAGASGIEFADSGWESVCLPHTWNNMDGQDGGTYYRGPAWYRNKFNVSKDLSAKRIFIRFGAAFMIADVFINGKFVGRHEGGFAAFVFDVTQFLNFGNQNVIAVKVDNTAPDTSPEFRLAPLDADFTMCGGLYRQVELIVTENIHIFLLDYGSPGVYITQEKVSDDEAEVSVRTILKNDSRKSRSVSVRTLIYDLKNDVVEDASANAEIPGGSAAATVQKFTIDNPHLWNGRIDPYVYRVVVSVQRGKEILDQTEQPLGLRYYKVDPEKGFFLNGRQYDLHGFCLHEDKENEGRAITNADRKQEMDYMLDIGATVVRMSHYQHGSEMYRLCDKYGIVVWTEIPLINHIDSSKAFADNCEQQLIELIRQNYNHPSIFFWGIFNEILNVKGPDPTALVKSLNELAKKEDPTRPSTSAANMNDFPSAFVTDVLGLNKYFGWYDGKVQDLGPYLDDWHKKHPDRAIGISEYGAGGSIFQHEENPQQPRTDGPWHPEEYQTYFHEVSWKAIEERPYIWFSTVWNGFEFSSDFRTEGFRAGINDKGLVTQDHSTKKDSYYWYKVNWNPAPLVHITGKRFTVRDTSIINVKVYSNADAVELFLNGASLGKARSTDHRFIWNDVKLNSGSNDVKAVAILGGVEYSDECWWRFDK
ncbi:MAG TPA: glycoside hydrolase family 2 TIM barrel-domain containing protein [Candidatus Kryptonia bacterium]